MVDHHPAKRNFARRDSAHAQSPLRPPQTLQDKPTEPSQTSKKPEPTFSRVLKRDNNFKNHAVSPGNFPGNLLAPVA